VRIVDAFTDVILFARRFTRGESEELSAKELRAELQRLFDQSSTLASDNGMSAEIYQAAKYPVVAYIDELLLCSKWAGKSEWQREPLQRLYFNTTSAGADFYNRLNVLNKFGPDRDVREVYALCLGLGFRGKYFRGEDRKAYEEVKAFNLSLLLPDEAQRNIDSAILFPTAYKGHTENERSGFKPRFSIYPIIIGVPLTVFVLMALAYRYSIGDMLGQLRALIQ
jgi:type VI secretion system protein ImpK